jgi:RNA polymerase sigma factor (TIGR02999 family)
MGNQVPHGDVTALLQAAHDGDADAFRRLYARLYDELRRLARTVRAARGADTINTTALVHEAYVKLAPARGLGVRDRAHFMKIAARAMRQVLVDAARRRQTRAARRPALEAAGAEASELDVLSEDVVALDRALSTLAEISPRQANVVECRFFAGLSIEDTAAALDVSAPTVKRDWRIARTWLAHQLGGFSPDHVLR